MSGTEALVLDASAVVELLAVGRTDPALLDRVESVRSLHAPHLVDVEVLHVLRRLASSGALGTDAANDARRGLDQLGLIRYPHVGLVDRMWDLRHSITGYDAAYVALAELLACPLATIDARLARAGGHRAQVEVYGGS
jgi:predicted nucleic acid-binding protein